MPSLLTFDVFGTIVDWRTGLRNALAVLGLTLTDAAFDDVINAQAAFEAGRFHSYREITTASLVQVLSLPEETADGIAQNVGRWPLFADSSAALKRLLELAPCIAMTNSDRVHGQQIQEQLGLRLSEWICAEDIRIYKPSPVFWHAVAQSRHVPFDRNWWHVSAYADYDLVTARYLGLTTVFVERAYARPGVADFQLKDLAELVTLIDKQE